MCCSCSHTYTVLIISKGDPTSSLFASVLLSTSSSADECWAAIFSSILSNDITGFLQIRMNQFSDLCLSDSDTDTDIDTDIGSTF